MLKLIKKAFDVFEQEGIVTVFFKTAKYFFKHFPLGLSKTLGSICFNATSEVFSTSINNIFEVDKEHSLKILFIGHDAGLAGAQILLLEQLRWLNKHTAVKSFLVLMYTGGLLQDFMKCVPTMVCTEEKINLKELEIFCGGIPDIIFGNTAVAAKFYEQISQWGVPIITYVHELEYSLQKYTSPKIRAALTQYSKHIICASKGIRKNLEEVYNISQDCCTVVNAFVKPKLNPLDFKKKQQLRKKLGLPTHGKLVFACGGQNWRKGVDLFVDLVEHVLKQHKGELPIFCWVGLQEMQFEPQTLEKIEKYSEYLFFIGELASPADYFQAADIFILSSREDPFPLVCLEAGQCALPIVCFAEAGDIPYLIGEDCGIVVPYCDVAAMSQACIDLLKDSERCSELGNNLYKRVLEKHVTDVALPCILNIIRKVAKKPHPVSVIVPNYNYARYLDARLESIVKQKFRDIELILLDDASTDDSIILLEKWSKRTGAALIINEYNSGSVNRQWKKGLEYAKGQFIWIAEVDDLCSEEFLSSLLNAFQDSSIVLAYTIPCIFDENGDRQQEDYRNDYLTFASKSRWNKSYVTEGEEEICSALAIINNIPNVSAVVFRKPSNFEAIDASLDFRCSGDWVFYLYLAGSGKVVYIHDAIAWHRRHSQSVVAKEYQSKSQCLLEEALRIQQFVQEKYTLPESTYMKMNLFIQKLQQV